MAQVNVYYDPAGRTLTVWFGRPQAEYVCEETGEEVVFMKDRKGRVIGFERHADAGCGAARPDGRERFWPDVGGLRADAACIGLHRAGGTGAGVSLLSRRRMSALPFDAP